MGKLIGFLIYMGVGVLLFFVFAMVCVLNGGAWWSYPVFLLLFFLGLIWFAAGVDVLFS